MMMAIDVAMTMIMVMGTIILIITMMIGVIKVSRTGVNIWINI